MKNNIPCFKIKDLAEIVTGTTPITSDLKNYGGDIKFITPKELDVEKYVYHSATTISKKGLSSSRLIPQNSLLVSCIGNIGKIGISGCDLVTNQQINTITFKENVDVSYAYYCFDSMRTTLQGMATSTTLPILNKSRFSEIEIPLPPLAEQRRIAAILDKADAIRRKRQQSLELADNLLKSVFLDMFGDPVTNPKGWGKFRVGTVLEIIEAGWSANGVARLKQHGELAVLKVSAVTYGVFNEDEYKVIENGTSIKKYVYPQKGDLLFSRANTRELVGATCLIFNDYPELLLPDKLWKLHFNEKTNNCYMKFALSSADARGQLTEESTGTSGSMYNISMEKLKNISVSLPPIALQNKFAAIAESMEASKCILRQANNEADHAFKSLQQSFFG